ncbi:DUF4956 domain-containing protein [Neolewinella antarctica]|uniref:DUF4956 domain-containing protein n=1 Tax=Neolewinella antarctica TaxID=442734 RepID=A0ABX0XGB9_9BACT|nr:DUF4956 domain-containing protein [Neolewinella antarctica]NJC28373.1 hypothetical protein [Neolewinella antarctica]
MFNIEWLNYDPETPSFYVVLLTTLFAFVLSSTIAITYEFTTRSIYRRAHYVQALILIGMVAAMVMQAIGDSLARGLGIIGALSIIRFRTVLDDPRNITFMFASLGAGIATGVLGFSVALTGTIVFCLAAVILRFSPLSNPNELIGEVRLQVPKGDEFKGIIESILHRECRDIELERVRFLNPKRVKSYDENGIPTVEEYSRDNLQEFTYLIKLKHKGSVSALGESLEEIGELDGLRLSFRQRDTKL